MTKRTNTWPPHVRSLRSQNGKEERRQGDARLREEEKKQNPIDLLQTNTIQ